jgi:hypothetical protein
MKFNLKACIQIIILFIVTGIYAQPNEAYIQKIRGNFDVNWLIERGNEAEATNLNWQLQTAVGFNTVSEKARRKAVLGNSWNFYQIEEGKANKNAEKVSLPHSFDRKRNYTSGWYFSKSIVSKDSKKRYFLKLDRVQIFCEIYINGKVVGHHFGGFTPFDFDVTDFLKSGENSIAIFVKDQSASLDNGKIYNQVGTTRLGNYKPENNQKIPGGIGREIYIEERAQVYLNEIFVKTSTRKKTLEIDYKISDNRAKKANITFEVFNWKSGEKVDLPFESIQLDKNENHKKTYKIKWENPKLWSPDNPNLYVLRTTLKHRNTIEVIDTRFGFREFWIDGKQFVLNGVPTRLRGQSHYRSSVQDVTYHKETFLMFKELFQENACRIHATMPPNEIMYAADEAGILLINQSAIWSVNKPFYSNGGEWFAKNIENEFEEWVKRDRNNPSVVIWDVENEMLRFNFETYKWIQYLPNYIRKNDTTRTINYSGAGWFDDKQEMVSLHMQEHYTRIIKDWKAKGTRPLIMGEFWVGGRSEQRLSNSPEFKSVFERNLEEALLYEEKLLEMRNLGVSALMPFRTGLLSFDKNPIKNGGVFEFSDDSKMYTQPDYILQKMRHGLQPVTTFFWPRETYIEKSENLKKELVVCNDSENDNTFKLEWKWNNKSYTKKVFIKAGNQERVALNLKSAKENEHLIASVFLDAENISTDTLFIKPFQKPTLHQTKKIQVYNDEILVAKLKKQGFDAFSSDEIPAIKDNVIWVFPEHANNRVLSVIKKDIENYLEKGGAVLSLKQDQVPTWFPIKFQYSSANQSNLHNYSKMGWEGLNKDLFFSTEAPIYDVEHPVFKNLNATKLHYWNNYDGRVADDVFARPSSNNKYEKGNWTTLSGGTRREQISLAEIFYGKGILLACQLNIIDNLENPQANGLFTNMINYLSERKAEKLKQKIKISGDKNITEFAKLLGVDKTVFEDAKPEKGNYLFAFDGTSLAEIKNWKAKGGKVIVLSPKLANTFNDVEIAENNNGLLATKINEHKLLNGISSANFLSTENSLAYSYFKKIPENATIILQGFISSSTFWKVEKAFPILISVPFNGDEILLSTIEIDKNPIASQQEFLAQLLTNCGVEIPFLKEPKLTEIAIKKTVPIKIDGNLEEWLQDMEDRLVSPYIHAQPIYLTSENRIEGPPIFDLNLSAINYMMWNKDALHIAGVVFMEKKFFGGERYSGNKNYTQEIRLNDDVITIQVLNAGISVFINGKSYENIPAKMATTDAREMTDAIKLQFNYTHASGKIKTWDKMIGETFELKIPWELLKTKATNQKGKALFTLENKDNKIQVPLKGEINNKENWLPIEIKE